MKTKTFILLLEISLVSQLFISCVPKALKDSIKSFEIAKANLQDQSSIVDNIKKNTLTVKKEVNDTKDPTSLVKTIGGAEAAVIDSKIDKIMKEQANILDIVNDNSKKINDLIKALKKTPIILSGKKRKKIIWEITNILNGTRKSLETYTEQNIPKRLQNVNKAIKIIKINKENNPDEVVPLKPTFVSGRYKLQKKNVPQILKFIEAINYNIEQINTRFPGQNLELIIRVTGYADTFPFQRYRDPFKSLCREAKTKGKSCSDISLSQYLSEKRAQEIEKLLQFKLGQFSSNIFTKITSVGKGQDLPYPDESYKPSGSDDEKRRICKLSAYIKVFPHK